MKQIYGLLSAVLITILVASCGTSSGDTNSRFGTWDKVSASQGNYVGLGNLQGFSVASGAHLSADTTAVDTSYIDNAGVISMNMKEVDFGEVDMHDYDFKLQIIDSTQAGYIRYASVSYTADSTVFEIPEQVSHVSNRPDYSLMEIRMNYLCNNFGGNLEYLIVHTASQDSSIQKIFKIRVDGMDEIAQSITPSCKSN